MTKGARANQIPLIRQDVFCAGVFLWYNEKGLFRIEIIQKGNGMSKWFVTAKKADFNKISEEFGISPVIARIIRNRDVEGSTAIRKFLYGSKKDLYSPMLLKDMDKAVEIIRSAIDDNKKIRVIGDYDVDGICATHILCTGLREAGADVDTAIPHRIKDGYGLNDNLIEEAAEAGIELIITCDNGIAAAAQIALAKTKGMDVVVTDHHEVPFEEADGEHREILPPADAVVDPKREECNYPFSGICGGVVAMKVVQALIGCMYPEKEHQMLDKLLPFAALATVCDVMELLDENRIIVKEGLKLMQLSPAVGLLALMQVNGLEPVRLNGYHLGYVLGPCINATGRLDTATRALELLGTSDRSYAMNIASELKELNDSRKAMTAKGVEDARKMIEQEGLNDDKVLVVYLPECHESLAGIIAGRLRESYCKPVFVLTSSEEGVKGSGRSIDAYHMYEEMVNCKECFSKFGGHKLAAGLSISDELLGSIGGIEGLRNRLNGACRLTTEDFVRKVHIDVPMPLAYADMELAGQIELLEPFGVGNPKPLFAQKDVRFISGKKMGANQNFAKYRVADETGRTYEVVFFGNLEHFHSFLTEKYGECALNLYNRPQNDIVVSITYQLGINSFKGKDSIQMIMQDYS